MAAKKRRLSKSPMTKIIGRVGRPGTKYLRRSSRSLRGPAGGGGLGPRRRYYLVIPARLYGLGLVAVGLLRRLWLWAFRFRDGFVCPFGWFAFGVAFGRPVRRWSYRPEC